MAARVTAEQGTGYRLQGIGNREQGIGKREEGRGKREEGSKSKNRRHQQEAAGLRRGLPAK